MTNKVVLRSTEEFMSDYVPVYQPIYPLFMGKSQSYSEEAGKVDFKRVTTVGDIRAKHITPKDTELAQIAVGEGKKTFKKYFLANQFVQSALQDREGVEEVTAQVLDEHQKQADELLAFGDGASNGAQVNNGLIYSSDPNYRLKSSIEIDTDADPLVDMHGRVMASLSEANQIAGRKVVIFYGADALTKVNGLFASSPTSFRSVLNEGLNNTSIVELPSAVTPASSNGWIVANLDQLKLHYTTLPKLLAQGVNDEKMYAWFNFLMGSMMLECLASGAIIRQPITFEA